MKSTMTTKKIPVITRVIVIVVSIDPQLDARGVACHGLRK
jgi:hypothetical protein